MKTKSFIYLAMAMYMASCSQVDDFDHADANVPTMYVGMEGQDDPTAVTSADIANVVAGFRGDGTSLARGAASYTTDVINDQDGNPAIYVINYADDGGFMLISARKSYHPVLAFSDEGHFDTDGIPESGLSIWEKTAIEAVSRSSSMPDDSIAVYRAEWRKYEPVSAFAVQADGNYDDEYYQQAVRILMDSMRVWQSAGYEIVDLNGDFMGDAQRSEQIRQDIEGLICPIYLGYETVLSVGIRKVSQATSFYPNFVLSRWDQRYPFNIAYPIVAGGQSFAGCGPVAAGQIMRYHEHPARYDWTRMDLTSGSEYTSGFLYDIAIAANADFKDNCYTSTTIDNMSNAFKQFGYSCQVYQANPFASSTLRSNIIANRPVYVRGGNDEGNGHAWIVSGYKGTEEVHTFEIYSFPFINELRSIITLEANKYYSDYYYMNWGWKGDGNGYYYILNNTIENPPKNYKYNYMAIWNIRPNK